MPVLLQICVVVVTMAIFAITVALVRALTRIVPTIEELRLLLPDLRHTLATLDELAEEARAAIAPIREITPAARRVASGFEMLGERAVQIAASLIDEVEVPVFTAVRLARGVRVGAAYLLRRWTNRSAANVSPLNGGTPHE